MARPPTIFVSGASLGIGREIARLFDQNGYRVAICASSEKSLAAFRKEFTRIPAFLCDMSVKDEVYRLSMQILETLGEVDVLVNNVGSFIQGNIHTEDDQTFEKMMHTNLFGAYYLTKALVPQMISRRAGAVVNMCSTASITPYANGGSYCISKYALLGFSKVLRQELKTHNIRVLSILPGATLTASWEGSELPPERFIPAADIARVVWDTLQLSSRTVVEEILIRPLDGDIG